MPNYCSNMITLGHDDPAMILRAKEAFATGNFLQEFIPVPKDLLNEETTTHYADVENKRQLTHLKKQTNPSTDTSPGMNGVSMSGEPNGTWAMAMVLIHGTITSLLLTLILRGARLLRLMKS